MIERLRSVGNITPGYTFPNFKPNFRGYISDSSKDCSWIVKDYELIEAQKKDEIISSGELSDLLTAQINTGAVKIELGLGFVVSSANVINLSLWRKDSPISPRQTIWTRDRKVWGRADLNEENSYCIGEGNIYTFERRAWEEFLVSKKDDQAKEDYLRNAAFEKTIRVAEEETASRQRLVCPLLANPKFIEAYKAFQEVGCLVFVEVDEDANWLKENPAALTPEERKPKQLTAPVFERRPDKNVYLGFLDHEGHFTRA